MALLSTGIMRGVVGDRPAASTATAGRLYFASDEAKVYRDNGSTWDDVTSTASAAGAIPSSLIDAEGDLIIGTAADTADRLAVGTAGYALVSRAGRPAWEPQYSTINFVIDGGGSAITTGIKGDIVVDYACTAVAWTLLADQSGAIKIDIWKDTYANFPPTDDDSMCGGHEPEIAASGVSAQDTDIADWSGEAIAAGSVLRFNVDSCTTIQRCTLSIKVLRG